MRLRIGVSLLAALASASLAGATPARAAGDDALHDRVRAELAVFTDWLARNRVKGYVGEVGWPGESADAEEWNGLAQAWYRDADAARLWVTAWATGEWWGTGYRLAVYEDRFAGAGVDSAAGQAAVLEAHPSTAAYRRGVNVAGGEFGAPVDSPTSSFSNASPGVYDRAYHYDSQATFDWLASRWIRLVRLPFRWERLQPTLGRKLDPAELGRLREAVGRARRAGLRVILDMHDYGAASVRPIRCSSLWAGMTMSRGN